MKRLQFILILFLLAVLFSCKDSFLEEKPESFLSPENAFVTYEDFTASVNNLYYLVRLEFFNRDDLKVFDYLFGTDIVFPGQPTTSRHANMAAAYDPTSSIPATHWNTLYKIVSEANVILSRLDDSELTSEQKKEMEAKARFFRGLSYRTLAYLFGGVPISTEEVTEPKTDFVRASREEVLEQVISDLEFASENLKNITDVRDGEVNDLAARHLLSEVYLAVGEFQEAVDVATVVIDDPAVQLMQDRFGSRSGETPGDVYWDLFRRNNQNRSSGNKEGLWVIQFEVNVLGGGSETNDFFGTFPLERAHPPLIRDFRVDGDSPFNWPTGDYTGGRGIGWAVSTTHFSDTIWQSDFDNDIRNANHNFVREYVANNPNSRFYQDTFSTQNPPPGIEVPSRSFYAYQTKATTPFNHPDELYANPETYLLTSSAGGTYRDTYMFRLAETYLLRAEAYLGLGEYSEAANDINVIRVRSSASPVDPEEVDLDYILDERMRELGVEEKRRLTLMRLGVLYDRVVTYNPFYRDEMLETYNLWPIPQAEIERNADAALEQNPGY